MAPRKPRWRGTKTAAGIRHDNIGPGPDGPWRSRLRARVCNAPYALGKQISCLPTTVVHVPRTEDCRKRRVPHNVPDPNPPEPQRVGRTWHSGKCRQHFKPYARVLRPIAEGKNPCSTPLRSTRFAMLPWLNHQPGVRDPRAALVS